MFIFYLQERKRKKHSHVWRLFLSFAGFVTERSENVNWGVVQDGGLWMGFDRNLKLSKIHQ